MTVLLLLIALLGVSRAAITFTGDVAKDFGESTDPNLRSFKDGEFGPDVGVPGQLRGRLSGWDIDSIHVVWDSDADKLHFGIDCFGVCGDADGDGNEGVTSPELTALGGEDLPGLARGEGISFALDFNLDIDTQETGMLANGDVPFDFMFGVPAGQPADANEMPGPGQIGFLECSRGETDNALLNTGNCFGLYDYQQTTAVAIGRRFLRATELDGAVWPVENHNPSPSEAQPDLEWTINRVSELRARAGGAPGAEWKFYFQAFAGSFLDAGIGEDFVPSQLSYQVVSYSCPVDACDICNGDGTTCLDCAGVANGAAMYDMCDVCDGDDTACLDCAGVPNGPAMYDVCDVCGGDGTSCAPAPPVDVCDIVNGDGNTCLDCKGVPNGPAMYDECDVCDGDGTSCCGPNTGRECCINYCGTPDAYWDFILLPVTIDNLIEKFQFTNEIFHWLCENLPEHALIEHRSAELHIGRVAELTRLFLTDCLEEFCEKSATIYSQLVFDNAIRDAHHEMYGPSSHLNGPLGA